MSTSRPRRVAAVVELAKRLMGLIEQEQLPAAEPRGGFSADHRAALEFGELARPSARPTAQLSPVSHGALIMPGAGEASRRAREPWLVPGGAADPAAHRVAPWGAPSELFPNILATTKGGRPAAESGETPPIAGDLHSWHNGGDRHGLPSKPWVAGSNPAGGAALLRRRRVPTTARMAPPMSFRRQCRVSCQPPITSG